MAREAADARDGHGNFSVESELNPAIVENVTAVN
jgi:hypothetical protein